MPAADGAARPIAAGEARELFADLAGLPQIALAVSGGRDSMALLRLLARWSGEEPDRPRLVALTVDHGLSARSGADAAEVGAWCAAIGLTHHTLSWDGVKPLTRIEERAREARYALLTGWCREHGVGALAVAHHLEDQAETVLMRLGRASGLDGLAAMSARSMRGGVTIVRPLLAIPRARLEATLARFGQSWIDDPANADPAFERVRLRQGASALADIGLGAAAIAASAAKLARAADALEHIAQARFAATVTVAAAGFAWLDADALAVEPEEIVIRVVGLTIEIVAGRSRLADGALARTALALGRGGGSAATLGHCRFARSGGRVLVVREGRSLPRCPIAPGTTVVWDDRFAVSLTPGIRAVELGALGARGFAAARRLNRELEAVPASAGAVLPGGFRAGELALAPVLRGGGGGERALAVRFLRCGTGI